MKAFGGTSPQEEVMGIFLHESSRMLQALERRRCTIFQRVFVDKVDNYPVEERVFISDVIKKMDLDIKVLTREIDRYYTKFKEVPPSTEQERMFTKNKVFEIIQFTKNLRYMDGTKIQSDFSPADILYKFSPHL